MDRTSRWLAVWIAFVLASGAPAGADAQRAGDVSRTKFQRARQHYERGEYQAALDAFEELYRESDRKLLRLWIAKSLLKLRKWGPAKVAAQEVLAQMPPMPERDQQQAQQAAQQVIDEAQRGQEKEKRAEAEACYKQADWPCARREYEALYAQTGDEGLLLRIGQVRLHQGEWTAAAEAAAKFLAQRPDAPAAERKEAEGVVAEAKKRLQKAEQGPVVPVGADIHIPDPPSPPTRRPVWRLALGSVAVAGGGTMAGFGIGVLTKDGQSNEALGPGHYETLTPGLAMLVPGAVLVLTGAILMAWPSPRKGAEGARRTP